jgi:alkyl sulfatase BDS1-like metallo-beta-lactamase superfamily hydrolase
MMALDLDQLIDTMAIRLDGPNTPATLYFTILFIVTDPPEGQNGGIMLTLSNFALTNRFTDVPLPDTASGQGPTLICTLSHAEIVALVLGTRDIGGLQTPAVGDIGLWSTLQKYLTTPNPAFAIVTP